MQDVTDQLPKREEDAAVLCLPWGISGLVEMTRPSHSCQAEGGDANYQGLTRNTKKGNGKKSKERTHKAV